LVATVLIAATIILAAIVVVFATWLAVTIPWALWTVGVIEVVPNLTISVVEISLVELTQLKATEVFKLFQVVKDFNNVWTIFETVNVAIILSHNSFPSD
jgi:hypothetical protein